VRQKAAICRRVEELTCLRKCSLQNRRIPTLPDSIVCRVHLKYGVFLQKLVNAALSLIIISIPAIFAYYLVTFQIEQQMVEFVPQWSDELHYWHQTATFRETGFKGGFYTLNEQPAPAPFIHFGPHGPIFPIIMGTASLISGWDLNSIFFINIAWLMFSISIFILYIKPDSLQLILVGLAVFSFWPAHLYMATCMRVVFFAGFAIITAAFFYHAIIKLSLVSRRHLILLFITISLLSLLKVTNSILFLPYFLVARNKFGYSLLCSILMAVVMMFISFVASILIAAPYPHNYVSELQGHFSRSFQEGAYSLMRHAAENVLRFFDYNHHLLWIMLRAQLLLTIFASCWIWWKKPKDKLVTQYCALILITSGVTAVGTILLYDVFDWRDFRLFAPIILMVTLLFIAQKRVLLVSLILLGNLIVMPAFFDAYNKYMPTAFPEEQTVSTIETFSNEIAPVIKYDKGGSGWDNTLLAPVSIATRRQILGVPAGIGISVFFSPYDLGEVKSRYLLLDKKNYSILIKWVPLELKASTSIGDLYVNRSGKADN